MEQPTGTNIAVSENPQSKYWNLNRFVFWTSQVISWTVKPLVVWPLLLGIGQVLSYVLITLICGALMK